MFYDSDKYMGFTMFFHGFLTIISTMKKQKMDYDNFFMTLTFSRIHRVRLPSEG